MKITYESYLKETVRVDWILTTCWPGDCELTNNPRCRSPFRTWRFYFLKLAQTERLRNIVKAMREGTLKPDASDIEIRQGFTHGREFVLTNGRHRVMAAMLLKIPTLEVVIVRAIRVNG